MSDFNDFDNKFGNSDENQNSRDIRNTHQADSAQENTQTEGFQNGYYSYKRPDTANSPEYSAQTNQSAQPQDDNNGAQQSQNAYSTSNTNPYSSGTENSSGTYNSAYNTQYGTQYNTQYNTQTQPQFTSAVPPKPPKKKKDKKRVSFGALVACCLICALLSGSIAAFGMNMLANKGDSNSPVQSESNSNGSSGAVINVEQTASNIVSAVAKKVIPSVVGIRVTSTVNNYFFGSSQDQTSEGSGVIYTSDGYIITNYHVISGAVEASNQQSASISVYLSSDSKTAIKATVIGYNSECDLAVIKIDKTGLTAAEFADSDKLEVGEAAIAVGNPGGLSFMSSVSSGVISGLDRTISLESSSDMKLIQTDAAINPGNSGGALCNSEGKIVGINSSKISTTSGFEGMGFAIPSNFTKNICDNIISNKDKKYAFIGVKISEDYDSDTLQSMGFPAGVLVEEVTANSPAKKAGISQYDIITSFNGVDISSISEYNKERLKCSPGDQITLTIYRYTVQKSYIVKLTVGESNS